MNGSAQECDFGRLLRSNYSVWASVSSSAIYGCLISSCSSCPVLKCYDYTLYPSQVQLLCSLYNTFYLFTLTIGNVVEQHSVQL